MPKFFAQTDGLPKIALIVATVLASNCLALAQSPGVTPILVELFTSEGCSSCPPADALLRKLDAQQPVAGAHLIVLEEHVDYWDDQGWKDPFSSHEFTLRQDEYARRLHVRAPYTPQMVVDGAYEFVGNDGRRAAEVFASAKALPTVAIRLGAVKTEGGKVHAHIEIENVPSTAEVYAAVALEQAESQVARGENGGRSLRHVAVLRSLTSAGNVSASQAVSKDVILPDPSHGQPCRLIVFLQEQAAGKITGAAVANFN